MIGPSWREQKTQNTGRLDQALNRQGWWVTFGHFVLSCKKPKPVLSSSFRRISADHLVYFQTVHIYKELIWRIFQSNARWCLYWKKEKYVELMGGARMWSNKKANKVTGMKLGFVCRPIFHHHTKWSRVPSIARFFQLNIVYFLVFVFVYVFLLLFGLNIQSNLKRKVDHQSLEDYFNIISQYSMTRSLSYIIELCGTAKKEDFFRRNNQVQQLFQYFL